MPLYPYQCESCGRTFEAVATVAACKKPAKCECGKKAHRLYVLPETAAPGIWPLVSDMGLAVLPRQVEKANELNKRHGIGATYRPDGSVEIRGRKERKKLLKLRGMFDRKGGYGD